MPSISVITLFPEMITEAIRHGLLGQALKKELLGVSVINPRDFAKDKHHSVDDRPFGGGDGMVFMAEVLEPALQAAQASNKARIIYLSPQGPRLTSDKARALATEDHLVLICGRYGGIDQRIINSFVDEELSIGDYVLSGGEVAALVVIEALSRFVPGVLGHVDSAEKDSFAEGLLEHPPFTKPRVYRNQEVPEALLSGNHALMAAWKNKVSWLVTLKKRPDLFRTALATVKKSSDAKAAKKKPAFTQLLREFYTGLSLHDKQVLDLENLNLEDLDV